MRGSTLQAIRAAGITGLAVALFATGTAWANGTPEGTVIRNIASVSFTDANSNTYAAVADTIDVTVGFSAGVDVIAQAATVNPATPSTGDTLFFDVANIGNGSDSVTVSESITDPNAVITVTGYVHAGTPYATLGALNTALAGVGIAADDTITIAVVYDVAADKGGETATYQMTGTSRRDNSATDSDQTDITPAQTFAVDVTPDGGQNLQHLPSNGTNYTFQFTVTNNGNGPEDFDLLAWQQDVSDVSIVSVNGVAGDSTRLNIGAGASSNIDVVYSVQDVAAGTQDSVYLMARSVNDPNVPAAQDTGFADLTVIRPSLTITKEAYRDDQTTAIGAGTVAPGEFIQYRVTVTNTGTADASSVQVTDALPAEVTFDSTSDDGNWSSITETAGTVTATHNGALASGGGSAFFWIRVSIN